MIQCFKSSPSSSKYTYYGHQSTCANANIDWIRFHLVYSSSNWEMSSNPAFAREGLDLKHCTYCNGSALEIDKEDCRRRSLLSFSSECNLMAAMSIAPNLNVGTCNSNVIIIIMITSTTTSTASVADHRFYEPWSFSKPQKPSL